LARGIEHEEALDAIDESLGLLDSLNNGYSLAQVKSTRNSLQTVSKKIHKFSDAAFIKALLALASGEFADGGQLKKVVDMLNDIRSNIVDSQNQEIQDEEASVEAFNTDISETK
jgi:hypothetical protein